MAVVINTGCPEVVRAVGFGGKFLYIQLRKTYLPRWLYSWTVMEDVVYWNYIARTTREELWPKLQYQYSPRAKQEI